VSYLSFARGLLLTMMWTGNKHCVLHWDGKEDPSSIVTVLDLSSNGTFVRHTVASPIIPYKTSDASSARVQLNGTRIGKGMTAILREGNELAFGAWAPNHGGEDFRESIS
jgi:serine/threonine/tyrosine protein kinase RAD53